MKCASTIKFSLAFIALATVGITQPMEFLTGSGRGKRNKKQPTPSYAAVVSTTKPDQPIQQIPIADEDNKQNSSVAQQSSEINQTISNVVSAIAQVAAANQQQVTTENKENIVQEVVVAIENNTLPSNSFIEYLKTLSDVIAQSKDAEIKKMSALEGLLEIQNNQNMDMDKEAIKSYKDSFKKYLKEASVDDYGTGYESDEEKSLHQRVRTKFAQKQKNEFTLKTIKTDTEQLGAKNKIVELQLSELNKQVDALIAQRNNTNTQITQKHQLRDLIVTANQLLDTRMANNKQVAEEKAIRLKKTLTDTQENLTTMRTTQMNKDDQDAAKKFAETCVGLEKTIRELEPQELTARLEFEQIKNKIETGSSNPNSWGNILSWRSSSDKK